MADNDTQLDHKKRARRRLVGAAALALLAAIVLPMVMDAEPRPTGQDIQVRIPANEGANFAAKDIQPPKDIPPAKLVPPEPGASEPALPATVAVPEPASAPATAPAPATAAAAPAAPTPAGTAAATRAEAPKPQVAKPVPDDASRAAAILNAAEGATAYVVQVGVFKDAANVASIKSRVREAGLAPVAAAVGDKTRIRVGPFDTREAAQRAADKLKAAGLPGDVRVRD